MCTHCYYLGHWKHTIMDHSSSYVTIVIKCSNQQSYLFHRVYKSYYQGHCIHTIMDHFSSYLTIMCSNLKQSRHTFHPAYKLWRVLSRKLYTYNNRPLPITPYHQVFQLTKSSFISPCLQTMTCTESYYQGQCIHTIMDHFSSYLIIMCSN